MAFYAKKDLLLSEKCVTICNEFGHFYLWKNNGFPICFERKEAIS